MSTRGLGSCCSDERSEEKPLVEWPEAEKSQPGIGGTHHLALQAANREALLKWKPGTL